MDELKARVASANQVRRARPELAPSVRRSSREPRRTRDDASVAGLTAEEQGLVLWRYPGDVPERRDE